MAPTTKSKSRKKPNSKAKKSKVVAPPIAPSLPITKAVQKRERLDAQFKGKSNAAILGKWHVSLTGWMSIDVFC